MEAPASIARAESTSDTEDSGKDTEKQVAIEIKENEEEKKKEENNPGFGPYLRLWKYGTPLDRFINAIAILSAIGAGASLPLTSIIFGQFVNLFNDWAAGEDGAGTRSITPAEFRAGINKNALYFVYIFVAKFLLTYFHTSAFTLTATRATRRIRMEYMRAILKQELAYFDSCTPGSVATRISTNGNMIQTGLSEKVGSFFQGVALFFSAFVVSFIKQWKLTLVTVSVIPGIMAVTGVTISMDARIEAQLLETYSKAGGLCEEALGSIRSVIAFSATEKLKKKYDAYLDTARALGVKKGPVVAIQLSTQYFVMYCAYAIAFWYGIKLLLNGEVKSGGQVVTVFFSVMMGTSAIMMIAPSLDSFTKAAGAAKDIFEMLDRESEMDSTGEEGLRPQTVRGRIELQGVGFRYPARPGVQVLEQTNILIEEKKTTALVGASGSGKSTIVALMERWYDPTEGTVLLDGQDIKTLNLRWLRSKIGLVQQEPFLFNDTIYNNVANGLYSTELVDLPENEKRALVEKACIEANAHDFIQKLPNAYDTMVGERGIRISGGQKQRVCLARSLISDPEILLLDEATSALDPKAEKIVQEALDRAAKSRTTVLIAHRLSTIKNADKIVVLNKGKVIEEGTHESLLAKGEAYYRLVMAQQLLTDDDDKDEKSSMEEKSTAAIGEALEKAETTKSNYSTPEAKETEKTGIIKRSLAHSLVILFSEQRQVWLYLSLGLLACAAAGAVYPTQAILFSKIVTVFQLSGAALKSKANFWALMFFVMALATLVAYLVMGIFLAKGSFIMLRVYRSQYFSAILSQDISFFDEVGNSAGALTAQLSSDPQAIQDLVLYNIGLIIIILVDLVGSFVLSFALSPKLAAVAIFGCVPPIFLAGMIRMRLELHNQEYNAKFFSESARFASEAVGAIRTVSSLTLEEEVRIRYEDGLRAPVERVYRRTGWVMILFGLSESIDMLGNALSFWYGGRLISLGEIDVEKFFIIFTAVIFGAQAAGMFFGFTQNMTKAEAAANQILHLRAQKAPINSSTGNQPTSNPTTEIAIEFRNVKFYYPTRPETAVFRNLNLSIPRGQTAALVGASGCGKTTVVALLERFYDIDSGEILINGEPLKSLDVHAYRSKVALVSQEPTLYQGSIRENILLGTPDDVPDSKVEQVATDANIHEFVSSLPDGYNTDVGTGGVALSGGQRQRIAVARAMIRDPEVLLLDEATSSLDTESEKAVQAALEKASKGRTTLMIAHRLSTVRNADRIFVMEEGGRIVEEGTHEELLRRRGQYWQMCLNQGLDRETGT